MSVQSKENAPSSVATLANDSLITEEVRQGLEGYLGQDTELLGVEAILRKEYMGRASRKVQVGGTLLVSLTIASGEPRVIHVDKYEIHENNRPFNEDLIRVLGRIAEVNWRIGKCWLVDL